MLHIGCVIRIGVEFRTRGVKGGRKHLRNYLFCFNVVSDVPLGRFIDISVSLLTWWI